MKKPRAKLAMVPEDDQQFQRFWDAYPKRVSKKDARLAWTQIDPTPAQVDRMVSALAWQCQQPAWTKDGGMFVPYPASWLRAERWTDEPPKAMTVRSMSSAVGDPMSAWLQRKVGA
jgi:hypothetical protein